MFFFMILYPIFLAIREIVLRNFKGESFIKKKIVPWLRSHNIEVTFINFFLEGNLDISLWFFISVSYVHSHGIGMPHFSDVFSNIAGFVIIAPLFAVPFYILYKANRLLKHKQMESNQGKYKKDQNTEKVDITPKIEVQVEKKEDVVELSF